LFYTYRIPISAGNPNEIVEYFDISKWYCL